MGNFYRINGLAKGLDGLVVEVIPTGQSCLYEVHRIFNTNEMFGDRVVSVPVPEDSLYIDHKCLEETADPNQEFTSDSPFGEFLYEGTLEKGGLMVAYNMYDNALSVTILERIEDKAGTFGYDKTVYSQNFFSGRALAMKEIEGALSGETDTEDLVFLLKEIKDKETN